MDATTLPGLSAEEQALYQGLRARTSRSLPPGWRQGLKCPGCGMGADRQKCAFEQGGSCPRHDPANYEDEDEPEKNQVLPWIVEPHQPSQRLADLIERLARSLPHP